MEKGASANFIARHLAARRAATAVHAFDSFEGLPEKGSVIFEQRGRFSLKGLLPPVLPNVRLAKGWFSDTINPFTAANPGPIALLQVDCDLYSPTRDILARVAGRLVPGSVIVFDAYFNYHNWQQHEFRAWHELVAESRARHTYRGFAARGGQVCVTLL